MAKRAEIAAEIRSQYGNLINLANAAKFLGMHRETAREFLKDVDCYKTGKEHKFLATDIARKLDSCKEVGQRVL